MALPATSTERNTDPGPIQRRRSYWAGSVGSDLSLAWGGHYPREIRVHATGNLNVTYDDGTTEVITGIPAGAVFHDCCWATILAASSTAHTLTIGW